MSHNGRSYCHLDCHWRSTTSFIPQLLVLKENDYQENQKILFNGAKVVEVQKGWEETEAQYGRTLCNVFQRPFQQTQPSEVAPALIREKSNYALVIELTDNLSSIATYLAYPYSNRFEHFFDTRDNADAELVNLEPV